MFLYITLEGRWVAVSLMEQRHQIILQKISQNFPSREHIFPHDGPAQASVSDARALAGIRFLRRRNQPFLSCRICPPRRPCDIADRALHIPLRERSSCVDRRSTADPVIAGYSDSRRSDHNCSINLDNYGSKAPFTVAIGAPFKLSQSRALYSLDQTFRSLRMLDDQSG